MAKADGLKPDGENRDIHVAGDYFEHVGGQSTINIVKKYITQFSSKFVRSDAAQRKNELILLARVTESWIDGVLKRSLFHEVMIELGTELDSSAIKGPVYPLNEEIDGDGNHEQALTTTHTIPEIYEEADRALLIIGAPGAGKTISLLDLTRHLVETAETDPAESIPVVFNLSSWAGKVQRIDDWLIEELTKNYLIPSNVATKWVKDAESHPLQLMLDGLDEVKQELRPACIAAINDFREEYGLTGIVVTCREQDYNSINTKLKMNKAVRLQPLTNEQIEQYCTTTCPKLPALHAAINEDPSLHEMARSPLMLSIMTLAYNDAASNELFIDKSASLQVRRDNLFSIYVKRMFARRKKAEPYPSQQAIDWLKQLANQMTATNMSTFHLEQLQPIWLSGFFQRWMYIIGSRMVSSIVIGVGCLVALLFVSYPKWVGMLALWMVPLLCISIVIASGVRVEWYHHKQKSKQHIVIKYLHLLGIGLGVTASITCFILASSLLFIPYGTLETWLPILFLSIGIPLSHFLASAGRGGDFSQDIRPVETIYWSRKKFVYLFLIIGLTPAAIQLLFSYQTYLDSISVSANLLNTKTGDQVVRLQGHQFGIDRMVISPNEKFIISIGNDGIAILRSIDGTAISVLEKNTSLKKDVRFSNDSTRIITISDEMNGSYAKLWDVDGNLIKALGKQIDRIQFSPDSNQIITERKDDANRIWQILDKNGVDITTLEDNLYDVRYACNCGMIITTKYQDNKKTIMLLNIDGQEIKLFGNNLKRIYVNSKEKRVVTEDYEGVFKLWHINGSKIKTLGRGYDPTYYGDLLDFSTSSGNIIGRIKIDERWLTRIWDMDGKEIKTFNRFLKTIDSMPGTENFIFINDNNAYIWDSVTDEVRAFDKYVREIHFIPDSSIMITENYDSANATSYSFQNITNRTLKIWKTDGSQLFSITEPYADLAVSPDGKMIATEIVVDVDGNKETKFWNLDGTENTGFGKVSGKYQFSSSGKYLVKYSDVEDNRYITFIWISIGLFASIFLSLRKGVLSIKTKPNQGIWLSARNALLVGAVFGVFMSLLISVVVFFRFGTEFNDRHFLYTAAFGIPLGIIGALRHGGLDFIRHFTLRLILRIKHIAPMDYARFLDYAADRIFLRKVGGGYIFVHRMLLEYFCALNHEQKT